MGKYFLINYNIKYYFKTIIIKLWNSVENFMNKTQLKYSKVGSK